MFVQKLNVRSAGRWMQVFYSTGAYLLLTYLLIYLHLPTDIGPSLEIAHDVQMLRVLLEK